jgi:hypothetical protein
MAFTARFHGTCTDCEDEIRVGEEIRSDGYGGFEHVACKKTQSERPAPVCPTCWLVQPCGCEDS